MSTLPEGTELKVSGSAHPTKWSPKTYDVIAHIPAGPGTVAMKMVGYVFRSDMPRTKAWVVVDFEDEIIVSPAPIQNESREWALWFAQKSDRWTDES